MKKIFILLFGMALITGCSVSNPTGRQGGKSGGGSDTPASDTGLVTSISLNYTTYDLPINDVLKLDANVLPISAKNKVLSWSSSNEVVAAVTQSGYVSGLSLGQATIKCISTDTSNITCECVVNVVEVPVSEITLSTVSWDFNIGDTFNLGATVLPSNATNKDLIYEIDNSNIATIQELNNNVCKVTAKNIGSATITAYSHDKKVSTECKITVSPVHLTDFEIGVDNINLNVNKTYTLNPTFKPINADNKNVTWTIGDTSVASIEGNTITALKIGTTTITGTTEDGNLVDTANINVTEKQVLGKTELKYNYDDLNDNNCYGTGSSPVNGTSKILVVPVWFTNSTNFISTSNKEFVREDINKSFFGTIEDYYSVTDYYYTESYGKLKIEGTTTDWYECNAKYETYATDYDKTTNLITSIISYAKTNWSINTKDYDADNDGFVDGLIMIYAAPDCSSLNNTKYENLWAYTYWTTHSSNVSNPTVSAFFWASYDFMYGSSLAQERTGKSSYAGGNSSYCELDTHTYIHEFGHVLGLDDYYDYSDNGYCAAGGFSMQDDNVGGHDPFSVMAFGWANPYIPTESCTIEINPFQESGDLILLTPKWNSDDSPFDEYLLIELYTPTRLNKLDSDHCLYRGYPQGPKKAGIRLWHIDARLAYTSTGTFSTSKITTNPSTSLGYVRTAMSNTYESSYNAFESKSYINYNLVQLIRNDKTANVYSSDFLTESDLFATGNSFSISNYKSQFVKSTKLNNGTEFKWSISFDSVTDEKAIITLNLE